jgi:hypothetical protein
MTSWTWSPNMLRWHEWLIVSLAFVCGTEGPYFYSDLVRGITVGLYVGALVSMLANRRALFVMLAALGVASAFWMTPRIPHSGSMVAAHLLSAFALLAPITSKLNEARKARSARQLATG